MEKEKQGKKYDDRFIEDISVKLYNMLNASSSKQSEEAGDKDVEIEPILEKNVDIPTTGDWSMTEKANAMIILQDHYQEFVHVFFTVSFLKWHHGKFHVDSIPQRKRGSPLLLCTTVHSLETAPFFCQASHFNLPVQCYKQTWKDVLTCLNGYRLASIGDMIPSRYTTDTKLSNRSILFKTETCYFDDMSRKVFRTKYQDDLVNSWNSEILGPGIKNSWLNGIAMAHQMTPSELFYLLTTSTCQLPVTLHHAEKYVENLDNRQYFCTALLKAAGVKPLPTLVFSSNTTDMTKLEVKKFGNKIVIEDITDDYSVIYAAYVGSGPCTPHDISRITGIDIGNCYYFTKQLRKKNQLQKVSKNTYAAFD